MMASDTDGCGVFKACPLCGARWETLADLVADRCLRVDGYSAFFDDPAAGLVFITHIVRDCGTTLTVPAGQLRVLFTGTDYPELHKGADDCHRLCLDRSRLEECDAECSMAWVRTVLQYLRRHQMPEEEPAAAASVL